MPSKFERLQSLLAELFQLDRADLDFGIYRIMNLRRDEITRFLRDELLPQVRAALAGQGDAGRAQMQAELRQAEQQAQDLGVDPGTSPKVQQLRERLAAYGADPAALEDEIYSHLYDFFRRYYDEGDFISMRRYKEGVYAIPYEGEEVKLHWANADQYYVKTSQNFRDYAFRLPSGRRVHFKLAEAETSRDNVKATEEKNRRFMLLGTAGGDGGQDADGVTSVEADELVIRFEYRADPEKRKQAELNALAAQAVLSAVPADWRDELARLTPTEANPRRTLLDKHLADYTARNTFDYFIHKDLRGFLRRELDFYIKNEIVRLDDIECETAPRVEAYLGKVRALRQVAHKIIDFLAQIEDFQKRLWLKKKFVVETNYCVTLDRVPEELYEEIAANDAQRAEWVRLFAIDEIAESTVTPGYSVPLTVAFLKANPFLVLDTKFFDGWFKDRLLASFDDLDAQTDGLLVHSENFQAINLLLGRYREQVGCIYIDPPYNTGDSEIPYKNTYLRSAWLSLMDSRLEAAKPFLSSDGVLFIAIDDFEMADLAKLIDVQYPSLRREMIVVNHHPQGGKAKTLAQTHEYMVTCVPVASGQTLIGRSNDEGVELRPFKRSGTAESNFRYARPNSFYAILVDPNTRQVVGLEPPPRGRDYPEGPTTQGYMRIYPRSTNGEERVWRRSYQSCLNLVQTGKLQVTEAFTVYQSIEASERTAALFSNWVDGRYNAGTFGANLLRDIIGAQNPFSYPKSIHTLEDAIFSADLGDEGIVLDYFAGSGTTGHAVINLNREDDGRRKYILIEMGDHFDTVLKPRIQKVIYSKDWKDGKPVSREGSSHLFKYLRLESYEDTLNNLAFRPPEGAQLALAQHETFREDYTLHYMLEAESRDSLLNVRAFEDPFNYTLQVATSTVGETRPATVDLVETFNYLLGLRVRHVDTIQGYRVVQGLNPAGERVLVIWRNLKEKSNADLETFFRRQDYNPRDMEFDLIYVNGDNHLENLRRPDETWKVQLIEEAFMRLMFDVQDV